MNKGPGTVEHNGVTADWRTVRNHYYDDETNKLVWFDEIQVYFTNDNNKRRGYRMGITDGSDASRFDYEQQALEVLKVGLVIEKEKERRREAQTA